MDRYQRVEKPREETSINENEIRITTQGRMRSYITYASSLLQEKESNEIIFKAMGRAINKTVMIVELIKRRIAGLHQNTAIGSTDITDTWEPLEEGLLPLETTRHVSLITITLSKKELDKSSIGYQSPLPADQVKPYTEFDYERESSPSRGRGRDGRGRGRGRGRESGPAMVDYNDGSWDTRGRGFGRGDFRGRSRGRGFRGRGRGNYGDRFDYQHEGGGYNEEASAAVQGRESGPAMVDYNDGSWDTSGREYGRGDFRGRGRGRGFRGRGRGNYGDHFDYQHDSGGYNEEAPAAVQGRESGHAMVDYNDGSWDTRGRGYGRGDFRGRGRGRDFRGRGRGNYGDHFDYQHDSGGYNEDALAAVQGRENGPGMVDYNDGGWDTMGRGYGRGDFRGRGRGRGFRGRGRGNYDDHFDYQHDSGGYIEEAPAAVQGRGRGRGGRNRGRGRDAISNGPIHADPSW